MISCQRVTQEQIREKQQLMICKPFRPCHTTAEKTLKNTSPESPSKRESRIIAPQEQRRNHASAAPSGSPNGFPRN
ncbi:hypothetical protein EAJ17_05035 [Akkermansia sp. aa_0143]|nr:hypothetical protein EAJ17_05035 [Akkermansia sp. aa_0143]